MGTGAGIGNVGPVSGFRSSAALAAEAEAQTSRNMSVRRIAMLL
jgi:hypothetical protein